MSAHVATYGAAGLRTELQVGRGGCQLIRAKMASKWRLHARYRKQRSRRSFMGQSGESYEHRNFSKWADYGREALSPANG